MREVHMGTYAVDKSPAVLSAAGLGSCIAVILFDANKKIGGLAHIMRPKYEGQTGELAKFADKVIPAMFEEMLKIGSNKDDVHAKIVGGANMFPDTAEFGGDVGVQNTVAAEEALKNLGVHITDKDTGGHVGKTVYFDLSTGLLDVRFKM